MSNLKILPLRDIKEGKIKKRKIDSRLPQPNFSMILLAPVKSGKSVFVQNIIFNKHFGYGKFFDEIWYFSPTIMLDKTGFPTRRNTRYNINIVSDVEDLENLDNILSAIIEEQKETNNEKDILLIFDDMIDYMKNARSFNALASRFRHFSVSYIAISQHLKKIPIVARTNAQYICVWKLYNRAELKKLEEEIGANFIDFMTYYRKATKLKYNFLFIDMKQMTLSHNFGHLLFEM